MAPEDDDKKVGEEGHAKAARDDDFKMARARKFADEVGTFWNQLRSHGINREEATILSEDFITSSLTEHQ